MIRKRLTLFVQSYVRNIKVTARNASRLMLLVADLQKLNFEGLVGGCEGASAESP